MTARDILAVKATWSDAARKAALEARRLSAAAHKSGKWADHDTAARALSSAAMHEGNSELHGEAVKHRQAMTEITKVRPNPQATGKHEVNGVKLTEHVHGEGGVFHSLRGGKSWVSSDGQVQKHEIQISPAASIHTNKGYVAEVTHPKTGVTHTSGVKLSVESAKEAAASIHKKIMASQPTTTIMSSSEILASHGGSPIGHSFRGNQWTVGRGGHPEYPHAVRDRTGSIVARFKTKAGAHAHAAEMYQAAGQPQQAEEHRRASERVLVRKEKPEGQKLIERMKRRGVGDVIGALADHYFDDPGFARDILGDKVEDLSGGDGSLARAIHERNAQRSGGVGKASKKLAAEYAEHPEYNGEADVDALADEAHNHVSDAAGQVATDHMEMYGGRSRRPIWASHPTALLIESIIKAKGIVMSTRSSEILKAKKQETIKAGTSEGVRKSWETRRASLYKRDEEAEKHGSEAVYKHQHQEAANLHGQAANRWHKFGVENEDFKESTAAFDRAKYHTRQQKYHEFEASKAPVLQASDKAVTTNPASKAASVVRASAIEPLVAFATAVKKAHWAADTKTNEHAALGELYEAVEALTDEFTEIQRGKAGAPAEAVDLGSLLTQGQAAVAAAKAGLKTGQDDDLLNIAADIEGAVNKAKYLLKAADASGGDAVTATWSPAARAAALAARRSKHYSSEERMGSRINGRKAAQRGDYTHDPKFPLPKVGQEVDYYHPSNGNKTSGVVRKIGGGEIHIQENKNGQAGRGDHHKFDVIHHETGDVLSASQPGQTTDAVKATWSPQARAAAAAAKKLHAQHFGHDAHENDSGYYSNKKWVSPKRTLEAMTKAHAGDDLDDIAQEHLGHSHFKAALADQSGRFSNGSFLSVAKHARAILDAHHEGGGEWDEKTQASDATPNDTVKAGAPVGNKNAAGKHNLKNPENWNTFAPGTSAHDQNANSFQIELPGGHLRGDVVQYNVNPLSRRKGFELTSAGHPHSAGLWKSHGTYNTHRQAMAAAHEHYHSTLGEEASPTEAHRLSAEAEKANTPEAHDMAGQAHEDAGNGEKAQEHYDKADALRTSESASKADSDVVTARATSDIILCRASTTLFTAGEPPLWKQGEEVQFMYMPAGIHTITAGFRNKAINLTVQVDPEQAAKVLQASYEGLVSSAPKQKPFGCIEHEEKDASVWAKGFEARPDGVYIKAEPSALGERNVNGKIHRSWSPSFLTDADYSKATEKNGCFYFEKGARGSIDNPARITGVAFCVGTLTNKPAFHGMSPVRAKEQAEMNEEIKAVESAEQRSEAAKKGWLNRGKHAFESTAIAYNKGFHARLARGDDAAAHHNNAALSHEAAEKAHREAAKGAEEAGYPEYAHVHLREAGGHSSSRLEHLRQAASAGKKPGRIPHDQIQGSDTILQSHKSVGDILKAKKQTK